MKRLIRKILREEIDKSDKHYSILDKISDHVQLPYFKSMEGLTIYEHDDQEYIMRKLLGNIRISVPPINLNSTHRVKKFINDEYGNEIYSEDYDGFWLRREYNENGDMTYFEDIRGNWYKYEYDEYNNEIYMENSYGDIRDNRWFSS